MLSRKLGSQIKLEAIKNGIDVESKLKNIKINGVSRGCSGFVTNLHTGSVVYVNTEKSCLSTISDKSMYRYARDTKDYSSNNLKNGNNMFTTDDKLASCICKMLVEGKGIER